MNDIGTLRGTPAVETTAGKVRGAIIDGVAAFKCIPYGASTSGANRFMPPRPPAPRSGVRDALDYTGHAPQQGLRPATRPELADFSGPPDNSPETEDCLTLNVWSPGLAAANRPVMVWFHGGAFSYGTANAARLQGSRLARRGDVVVVTVNQRLNILGFLDLSAVGGADFAASGNAGTLDMIAALHWCVTTSTASAAIEATSRSSANWAAGGRSAPCSPCRPRAGCSTVPSCRAEPRSGCANPTVRPG